MSTASTDERQAKTGDLRFRMILCTWGLAVLFTAACGLFLVGEPFSMWLGFMLLVVGNFCSLSIPIENRAGELKPSHAWTEPVTKRFLAYLVLWVAVLIGLGAALDHWIPDTPEVKEKAMHFFSHPLVVVPVWAGMMWLYSGRWRRMRMAKK